MTSHSHCSVPKSSLIPSALTKSIAVGLGPRRITVNAIMPGATDTELLDPIRDNAAFMKKTIDQIPFGRLGEVTEIVPLVDFLASPEAGWITGQTIAVSGGMHL
jgi:3-oxoacyl-[acyl-carrier protein] reductase